MTNENLQDICYYSRKGKKGRFGQQIFLILKPIRLAVILSLCVHLIVIIVSSSFVNKPKMYSTIYTMVDLRSSGRAGQQLKNRPAQTSKEKSPEKKKLPPKEKEQTKKEAAPKVAKEKPKPKKNKVENNKKDSLQISSKKNKKQQPEKKEVKSDENEDIKKAIAEIRQKKEKDEAVESVEEAVDSIRQKLLSQDIPMVGDVAQSEYGGQTGSYMDIYYSRVWSIIKSNWLMPDSGFDQSKELVAVITLKIYKDGTIEDIRFESESGDSFFDRSAIMAIKRVGNLPPLPSEVATDYIEVGFIFSPTEG